MRVRFGEVTRHQFHDHQDVREFIIRTALDGLDRPVVILGDGLVEMAELPKTICGRAVVNAGIGGSRTSDFIRLAPLLLERSAPTAVVIALGVNDSSDNREEDAKLLESIRRISPVVISMPTTADRFEVADLMADRIHLRREASVAWVSKITNEIERTVQGCD